MFRDEVIYQNCIRCAIPRTSDYLDGKGVCEFCKPPMQQVHEQLLDCSNCGAEFYSSDEGTEFFTSTCFDCSNDPYL